MINNSSKIPLTLICTIAVIAGFWLFNPFSLYFLNDDFIHIPLSKEGVLFQRKSFRPVCDLSVALDYFLWKKEAWGYHITNLLLHVADSLLVYYLAKLIFKKYTVSSHYWEPIFAAVLFFIYPFHSEAIYWIIGRSGTLGALFFLPAVIFYLLRNEKAVYFFASLFFFSIGLLTYESVWVFPLVAVGFSILDISKGLSVLTREIRFIVAVIVLFVLFAFLRYAAIGEVAGNYDAAAFKHMEGKNLLLNMVRLFIRSLAPPATSVSGFADCVIIVMALLLLVLNTVRKSKVSSSVVTLLFIFFVLSLIPYLSLGIDTHGTEGERFLYLPSIFICLFIIHFIFSFVANEKTRIGIMSLVFAYSLFFLFQSQKNFLTAGKVTMVTVSELEKLEGKSRLFIDNLPEECNGAVIFRSGFYEAVKWMKPLPALNTILVSSSLLNIKNVIGNYKVIYKDASLLRTQKDTIAGYNSTTDVVFIYSDSTLTVVK